MCPNDLAPPELKLIVVGRHGEDIPLLTSRDMSRPPQTQQPPQLTPSSLFDAQADMDRLRLQVFNRILGNIHERIKFTASKPNSPQMVSYNVPEWQPGCPRFDVKDCILYIVWNLRQSGFKVLYVSPNRLLISWKEQAMQYFAQDSPIRQAMMTVTDPLKAPVKSILKKTTATYKPVNEGVAGLLTNGSGKGSATITFI